MRTLLFLLLLTSVARAVDENDPATELASFQLPEGFQANLFASEVDGVIKPIQCRFDHRGRLWVIQSSVYPQIVPGQEASDKVLILQDIDGDGRSDRSIVFADGLMIPTGIELMPDGCLVGHGTELLRLRDTDGDDRADVREVLLRGFGTGDNHQNINSFTWGPHGELWFSQGLHSNARVETPWGIEKLDKAGIWRLWPRRLRLDPFFGNNIAPHNPWGFIISDWGDVLIVGGNGHGIYDTLPAQIRYHRPIDAPQIWVNHRGRKLCGVDIVGTRHFPDSWQGLAISGGFMSNEVFSLRMEPDGAGFRVTDGPVLVKSSHKSFRPVDVRFGHDGAAYIADWYNPIIGHYQASFRHPDRDKLHGRIWRITAKDRLLAKAPPIEGQSVLALLEMLKSDERWVRLQAARALANLEDDDHLGQTTRAWISNQPEASRREEWIVGALGVLEALEIREPALVELLMRSPQSGARSFVATSIAQQFQRSKALAALSTLAQDAHPRVRMAAVVAATYFPSPEAMGVVLRATDSPTDRFLDYAINQAVHVLKPHWLPAFQAGKLDFGGKAARLAALAKADGSPDTLLALRESLAKSPGENPALWETLAEIGDENDLANLLHQEALLADPALHARVLNALAESAKTRAVRPNGEPSKALESLLAAKDLGVRRASLRLIGAWRVEELRRELDQALTVSETDTAALEGLAALDLAKAVAIVAERLTRADASANTLDLLPVILARQGGSQALAKALGEKPPAREMAAAALRRLNEIGRTEGELLALLHRAAGTVPASAKLSADELAQLVAEINAQGDAMKGREVFRRPELACTACHAIGGEGGLIGPPLDAIGSGQPVDFILGAVLSPAKEVKESYDAVEVQTKDGQSITGYRAGMNEQELALRELTQNKAIRLPRASIQSIQERGTLMPEGLTNGLRREELRDLIRYLSLLGRK